MASPVTGRAVLVPGWAHGSYLVAAGFAVLTGGLLATLPVAAGLVGLGGLGAALAQWWVRRRSLKGLAEIGRAYEAGPEGLRIDGQLIVETRELSAGALVPNPDGAAVVLQRGRRQRGLRLQVGSVEEGRALLDALGLGVRGRTLTRKVASWWFSKKGYGAAFAPFAFGLVGALVFRLLGLPNVAAGFGLTGFAYTMGSFYTVGFVKTRVTIGADGVRITWLARDRLIPLTDIERVEARRGFMGTRLVTFYLRSGEVYDITVAMRGRNVFEPFDADKEQALLFERIGEALRLGKGMRSATLDVFIQDLGDLPVREWMHELRLHVRAGLREGGSRVVEGLLDLAELTSAAPALRAAAAVALGPALDEAGRRRLHAAAEATAAPRLRVVLEAAADDRDSELIDAFTELSNEHRAELRVLTEEQHMAEAEHEVEMLLAEEDAPYRSRGR